MTTRYVVFLPKYFATLMLAYHCVENMDKVLGILKEILVLNPPFFKGRVKLPPPGVSVSLYHPDYYVAT
jgi:hypothetical protein